VNILVVDDHPKLRGLLAGTLTRRLGADVEQAGDVEEALTKLTQAHFDVVMMDVNLPRVTGLEAVPALRAAAPGCRVVLMSAAVMPGLESKALRAGADMFIAKSAGLEDLCSAVQPGWQNGHTIEPA
jgi:CheY-like chemotaxis protein